MIDFRYHLVSIIAVFLALATGLVLGSTLVNNMVLEGTERTADGLSKKNADLRQDLLTLQQQERSNGKFVDAMAPKLLAGELEDERVVVYGAPGADTDQVKRVVDGVKQAGGTVSGTVTLSDSYADKRKVGVLGGLTDTLAKNTELNVPTSAAPAERAAYLLAHATVTKEGEQLGKGDEDASATLSSFKEAKFLDTTGAPQKRAQLAVVVGPEQRYSGKQAAPGNLATVELAKYLDTTGEGAVLSAPTDSAGTDGVVSALRGDEAVKKDVSTVDNLDAPPGYVVTVLALALDGNGSTGQWGSGAGSGAVAPTPTASGSS